MKNLINIILLCLLLPVISNAQYLEIGGIGGFSTYSGDLNPTTKMTSHGEFRYSIGGFLRYNFNDYFTAKLGVSIGRLSARDYESQDPGRKARNLQFKSVFVESAFTIECNILGYDPIFMTKRISPYVFAGIGVVNFNPKTLYNGEWVELQPLNTEGQGLPEFPGRKPYKKVAMAFPFGFGVKVALTDRINVGFEAGLRKTTTDYLDDVSKTYLADNIMSEKYGQASAQLANRSGTTKQTGDQRGSPENKDWYAIGGMTISYNLTQSRNKYGRRRRKPMRCPTF
jgi:opacity protein-like surface antigen